MSNLSYNEMISISKQFYDTIDFTKFLDDTSKNLPKLSVISMNKLMDVLKKYYEVDHPELLPPEFQGYFFNLMDLGEFAEYISKRYGYDITENITIEYVLTKDIK